ncbi:hypothetical protein QZH41_018463 [Actinostola sp. cb2023]|nr:hypothetical protein QZH41_018463 [Actinostola sp. cb2023]
MVRKRDDCVAPFPDIELQCRVIKKWNRLSTLLIDVIPWCLLVNNTLTTLYVRDRETNMTMELLSSQTIAPYKFKGKVQLGMHVAGSDVLCWSKPVSIPSSTQPSHPSDHQPKSQSEQANHVTISIVHVTKIAQPIGVQLTMTSRLRHGVRVVSFQEKFCIINSTSKPLVAFTALAAQGKKMPSEALAVPRAMSLPADSETKTPVALWSIPSSSSVVLDEEGRGLD